MNYRINIHYRKGAEVFEIIRESDTEGNYKKLLTLIEQCHSGVHKSMAFQHNNKSLILPKCELTSAWFEVVIY